MKAFPILVALAIAVYAQSAEAQPAPGRIELAIGGRWLGGQGFGSTSALLTTPSGGQETLFEIRSEQGQALGLEGRLGVRIAGGLWLTGTGSYGTTTLRARVTDDLEDVPDTVVEERVRQYSVGGLASLELEGRASRGRTVPVIWGGVEFLRDLHAGRTYAETGRIVHTGAGVAYRLGRIGPVPQRPASRRPRSLLLRINGRLAWISGGAAPEDGTRIAPGLDAFLALRF